DLLNIAKATITSATLNVATDVVTVNSSGGNFTIQLSGTYSAGTYVDYQTDSATSGTDLFLSTVPCYAAGTRILAARGEVAVDRHGILLAEGLPAESYLNTGNHGFFSNSGEPLVLHPDMTDDEDLPSRVAGSCAPFAWEAAQVRPVWQRLAERAAALGRPVAV